ncbi:hypothetical protein G6F22_015638 [Rhizopus arrhizus]|nr:hypothetical protein G6F22_015638 [Rhizopus arrhizus]
MQQAGDQVHAVEQEMRADPRLQRIGLRARVGLHLRGPAITHIEIAQRQRRDQCSGGRTAQGEAPEADTTGEVVPQHRVQRMHDAGADHRDQGRQGDRRDRPQYLRQPRQRLPQQAQAGRDRQRQPQRETAGRQQFTEGPVATAVGRQGQHHHHQLGQAKHRRQPRQAAQLRHPRRCAGRGHGSGSAQPFLQPVTQRLDLFGADLVGHRIAVPFQFKAERLQCLRAVHGHRLRNHRIAAAMGHEHRHLHGTVNTLGAFSLGQVGGQRDQTGQRRGT